MWTAERPARRRPGGRRSRCAWLAPLVWTLLAIPSPAARAADLPAVLSPRDGDQIPRAGIDPPCVGGYCLEAHVEGRVGRGYWPFVGVRPEASSPRFWIQDLILEVAPDGTFETNAGIGAGENGARQHFDVFIIAHRDPRRFAAWDVLLGIPDECVPTERASATASCIVSRAATIYRTR